MKTLKLRFQTLLAVIVLLSLVLSAAPGLAATSTTAATAQPAISLAPENGAETCQVLQPAATAGNDSYIKQDKKDERRGGDSELRVKTENGKLNRTLLRFDVSGIPAGSTISSATLSLWVKEVRDGNVTINAHKLTNSWNEPQVTWKARDKAANQNWSTEGGDYNAVVIDSEAFVKDVKNYWATWNLTSAVTDWLNTPATNYGVILESPVTSPKNETKFKSSDDGTAAQRPMLEICYSSGLTLTPDNSGTGVAGQTRTYAHVAMVGPITGNFTFNAVSSQGWSTRIYRDLNGNGIKEAGDTQITTALALGPNVSFPILVEIDVPAGVAVGAVDSTTVTAAKQGSALSASAIDRTQVGGSLTLQPNHDNYAVAGSVLFYGHTLTNNTQSQDCFTVSAVSSEGWTVLLWNDLNHNGVHETVNPNEPALPSPVCLNAGQTQYIVAEVHVPANAAAGTVDTTVLTALSANQPGKFGLANDVTRVFVNDPPVIDGKYDDVYTVSPDANEVCYSAGGVLFGKLATFYQPAGDSVYMVLAIDKDFVDNTYGANAIGWPGGHTFGNLTGSDHAQFLGYDANDNLVLDFKVDYLTSTTINAAHPSGYASLGVTGGEGDVNIGSAANITAWGTSMDYSMNQTSYCSGGVCTSLGTDLEVDSPATDAFYTPNATYPDWIFDVIYEVKINKAAFGAAGFGSLDVPYIHASPSKAGNNTIIAEPGVCPGEIGDTVWHDINHDGDQDAGEPGLSGVSVRLYRDNGDGILTGADTLVSTQTTNVNGKYLFQNLVPDDYFVSVNEATVPAGYVITTYNNPTPIISLGEAESYLEADFGYTEPFAALAIEKTLLTEGGIFVGQNVEFSIKLTNTGSTTITSLPLEDYYDPAYLSFAGATPNTNDNTDDGVLNWSDLTQAGPGGFGVDLAPGQSFTVVLTFQAAGSTLGLPLALAAQEALSPTADPVVDGLLDANYNFVSHFTAPPNDAPGNLYGFEGASACYWTLVVDRAFNSNVYADSDTAYLAQDGWSSHKFGDLKGSDKAVFTVTYPGGSRTITLDLLNGTTGAWTSGFTGADGSSSTPSPAGSTAKTSLHWNLENSNWNGGVWGDPLKHSPPFNYNQTSGQYWEWNVIYEFSVPKSATNGVCGTTTLASAHTSPAKFDDTKATLGDRVWQDVDRDGAQDAGEVGLPGVTVNLYQGATLVRTIDTEPGTSGFYRFGNLAAGSYTVRVDETTVPANYGLTSGNMPLNVSLSSGQDFTTADFGYYLIGDGVIGDRVFYDLDGSGLPDGGAEPGLNGVVVNLYQGGCPASGSPFRTLTTAGNGGYLFQNLIAGSYCVDVDESTLPAGLTLSTGNQPLPVTLATNASSVLTADFGYRAEDTDRTCDLAGVTNAQDSQGRKPAPVYDEACAKIQSAGSIGDYVWNDVNGNGLQDDGANRGLNFVTVRLYQDDGDQIFEPGAGDVLKDTKDTAGDGAYSFDNLAPAGYWVDVDETDLPGYFFISGADSGPEPHFVNLGPNQAYQDADFGYAGKGNISGTVFFDWNENGQQDLGDDGIPSAQVCLYADSDNDGTVDPGSLPLACMNTDGDGNYLFTGYLPGNYLVVQSPIPGLDNTTPLIRDVTLVVIGASGSAPDNDFGNVVFGTIGDFIYLDSNGNGSQQPSETLGIANVPVTVRNVSTGVETTVASGPTGLYTVGNLAPGVYEVRTPASLPGLARTTSVPHTVNLGLGQNYILADFGYIAPTAVQVASFTAAAEAGSVVVRWTTSYELGQDGFQVWRSTSADGAYALVSGVIGAANSETGASYEWADESVEAGAVYWYKLQSLPDGQFFGPTSSGPDQTLGLKLYTPMIIRRH